MKKVSEKTDDTDDAVKKDDEAQSQRFIETAKDLKLENSEKTFGRLMGQMKISTKEEE